ncbi:MAG: 4-hydroxythreonine-4-phosphate dehydrogenase PdxA [Polyangiaceae bacterium]
MLQRAVLFVSVGCPAGIGPEVAVAAAADRRDVVLVGDRGVISAAARLRGIDAKRLVDFQGVLPPGRHIALVDPGDALSVKDYRPGRPSHRAGRATLRWIDTALALVQQHPGSALVTGPVSKAAIARSGAPGARAFAGHTEHLERSVGAGRSVMCFHCDEITTALVTTHLPVAKAVRSITPEGVERATVELAQFLRRLGTSRPLVAVTSLNPHAGEDELLGSDEKTRIVPGVRRAKRRLGGRATVQGPIGAETAFRLARMGKVDGVVTMLHDQATIPTKLIAFGKAVNVTLGLPLIRTSVDHGTAYDIAWTGRADESGMRAALQLAARLTRPRSARKRK